MNNYSERTFKRLNEVQEGIEYLNQVQDSVSKGTLDDIKNDVSHRIDNLKNDVSDWVNYLKD